jgi:hypothetical protein
MSTPQDKDRPDHLLQRYAEANALDGARPRPSVREAVLVLARDSAEQQAKHAARLAHPRAANDSAWRWRAAASVAVVGLVGLLVLQFQSGTPEDTEAVFGGAASPSTPAARAPAAAPQVQEKRADPAPAAVPPGAIQRQVDPELPSARLERRREQAKEKAMEAPGRLATVRPPAPMDDIDQIPPPAVSAAPGAPDIIAPPLAPAPAQAPGMADAPRAAESAAAPLGAARQALADSAPRATTPNGLDSAGTSLPATAARGDLEALKRLLAQGADVNARDEQGRTALMQAARRGDAAMVRALLEAGADVQRRDAQGRSAADMASAAGHPQLLPLLQQR